MRKLIAGICLALVACAGATNVVPEGGDKFMVASHGTMGWSSGSAQKAKALEEADAYCKQLGKQMEVVSESDSGAGGFGKISSGEVHFRCVPGGK
jgi:hypothetical protein